MYIATQMQKKNGIPNFQDRQLPTKRNLNAQSIFFSELFTRMLVFFTNTEITFRNIPKWYEIYQFNLLDRNFPFVMFHMWYTPLDCGGLN